MSTKEQKKMSKSKIRKFTILLTPLVETFCSSMHEFGGMNLTSTFRRCRLKVLLPYHLVLINKKMAKLQNLKFTILRTPLAETLPRNIREFGRVNLLCKFRDVLELFPSIWCYILKQIVYLWPNLYMLTLE